MTLFRTKKLNLLPPSVQMMKSTIKQKHVFFITLKIIITSTVI